LPSKDERPAFGSLLRRLRLNANLSQEALAERARISVQAVSALERGTRLAPQAHTLQLLSTALELVADDRDAFESAARDSTKARVRRGEPSGRSLAQRDLPSVPTSFLGREVEIDSIGALLRTRGAVTIWGPGGVGKTRLAIEVASVARERFPDGTFFVELASVVQASGIASALAFAVGFTEKPDGDIADAVFSALASTRALIVLDNCEHVVDGCARLAERLLAATHDVALLCTSREPLRVAGEHVYVLGPLTLPRADDDLAALRASVAVRLFLDRASSAGTACTEDARGLGAVATICRRLDGIPLAIELAAARLPSMDVAGIAAALDDRFALLTRGRRTAPSRQQTLAGALDWSHDLLSAQERIVFRRLGVLAGMWTLDDAWAVARSPANERWTVIDVVAGLVDKALVAVGAGASGDLLYRMLETTREYALARLREAGELGERERMHAHHIRALAGAAQSPWSTAILREPFGPLNAENVRAALDWSIARGNDPGFGGALAGAVSFLWDELGQNAEGLRWIDASIASFDVDDISTEVVEAWLAKARLANALLQYRDGYDAAERAILLADRGEVPALRGLARALSGYAASRIDDHATSRRRLGEALTLLETSPLEGGTTWALYMHAFGAFQEGRSAEARDAFERVVASYRSTGDARDEISALIDLAEAEYVLDNRTAAIARAREAESGARTLRVRTRLLTAALANLAAYLLDSGDVAAAAQAACEACTLAFEQRNRNLTAIAILYCAFVGARRGMAREAAELAGYTDRTFHGYTERRAYDALMLELHEHVPEDELIVALAAGEFLDEEEAVGSALRIAQAPAVDGSITAAAIAQQPARIPTPPR
jgi:predicted ATPase/DNA-binding XRE family transcriptional regulator